MKDLNLPHPYEMSISDFVVEFLKQTKGMSSAEVGAYVWKFGRDNYDGGYFDGEMGYCKDLYIESKKETKTRKEGL